MTWMIFLFLLVVSMANAKADPRNVNPQTPDAVYENDLDLSDAIKHANGIAQARTLAQIQSFTPRTNGVLYWCSNCASANVCVSTGVTVGAFSNITSKSTACN